MDKITKRDRSANFTLQERDFLASLVQKYKTVLENKKSGKISWKKKEAAWESIQKQFNAQSGFLDRSTKTLRLKYKGLKSEVRKNSAAIRLKLYRAGGGKNTALPLDNVEEQIKAMISLSADGLESVNECDTLPQSKESLDGICIPKMECIEIPPSHVDTVAVEESDDTQNEVLILVTNERDTLPLTTSAETRLPEEQTINLDIVNANVPNKTHDEVTQARLELVQLQKEFLEAQIIEKKKVWEFEENERKKEAEFKEKERKWKEKEYKLKLGNQFEILNKFHIF